VQGDGRQKQPPIGFLKFHQSPMQVTQEDGGKLNAFANEPRMVVMEPGEAPRSNRLLLIGGGVLVLVLMVVASRIS